MLMMLIIAWLACGLAIILVDAALAADSYIWENGVGIGITLILGPIGLVMIMTQELGRSVSWIAEHWRARK